MEPIELQYDSLIFTYKNNNFEIKGHLILETEEQNEILLIINNYSFQPESNTIFNFKVHYLDGQKSVKFINNIYLFLKKVNNLTMYWNYDKGDIGGKEIGEYLIDQINIPLFLAEINFDN